MIAQFLHDNGLQLEIDIEKLREVIQQHIKYNTLITLYDDKGLYAVARFNIIDKVAVILDTAIRKDRRSKEVLRDMIREGLMRFPKVKSIKFERVLKHKPFVVIPIKKFLKEQ
jgi:hypothetical protein